MAELVLALDLPTRAAVWGLLERLPQVRWVKVGAQLMTAEGPGMVRELARRGHAVLLDLKWHDIPTTVRHAVAGARELGVSMATVHALGGMEMMAAAAEAAGAELAVVAVTVLSSHTPASYAIATGRVVPDLAVEAARLGRLALDAGLAGVVCSAREAEALRHALGRSALIVVPGIRREEDRAEDQSRAATPVQAVRAGATHLIVGRPVLRAADPEAAWAAFRASVA